MPTNVCPKLYICKELDLRFQVVKKKVIQHPINRNFRYDEVIIYYLGWEEKKEKS